MPTLRRTEVAAAAALALLVVSSGVKAQQAETPPVQRIEITGSNIKRIDAETSSPVQVIKREDIARSGATTVRELLDLLPASNNTALSDINGSNSFASGASSADLRNLGKQSTLVLLNSRRVAPYALADFNEVFTNLDALPLDAVERVEILRNGASAIYGSDAVAGVINIITRKDYQGFQIGADYQKSLTSHRFGESSARMTGGFGDYEKDRFNVLANLELFHRDNVMWRDVLDYANPEVLANIPQGTAQYSTYSYPGNIIGQGPVAGCDPQFLIGGLCRYDRFSRFEAQPKADRANLLVSGRLNLGNDLEAFAEVLYSRTKTTYTSVFPYYGDLGTVQWGNASTGGTETFIYRLLPPTSPLNQTGDPTELRYRFVDSGAGSSATSDNYRLLTGLRGNFKGYDWESALAFLGSSTKDQQRGQFSNSGFISTIGDYNQVDADGIPTDPNFFNQPNGYHVGQSNSAEVLNTLFPYFGTKGKTTQIAWDGKVSGDLMQMAGGPLAFATGFDLRHEKFSLTPSDNLLAGDIVGFGVTQTDASRNFGAVFGELSIPLAKSLETQVAARIDKFPNFGAHVSPKVGLRYQPVKEVLLRGTAEGGFRAPNLTESAKSRKSSFDNGITDPKRCAQATMYSDDLIAQSQALEATDPTQAAILAARADTVLQNECAAGVPNITSYNPDLKPEVSRSYSLGLVLEPSRGFNMSLDYWNIHRKDEIGLKSTQELLAQEGDLPPGVGVTRNDFNNLALDPTFNTQALRDQYGVTVGSIQSLTNRFENVSRTKTSGIDLGVNASMPTDLGRVAVGLQSTYLISYYSYSTVKNDYGDNLAGRYGYSRFRATLDASLESGSMVNGFRIVHRSQQALQGDYYDTDWNQQSCADSGIDARHCRVAPYSRLDYYFIYKGIKNLTVNVYLRNVLNRYPPFDLKNLYLNGGLTIPQEVEDAQRRTLKIAVDYKF